MTSAKTRPTAVVVARHWRALSTAALFLCGHQLGEAGVPVIVGALVDDAIARHGLERLCFWLIVLAADFAVLSLSWRFGARFAASARLGIEHDLRMLVVRRVLDPHGAATSRRPGELITIAASDARRVASTARILASSAAALVVLVAAVAFIARTSGLLALLVVGAAVLVLVGVSALGRLVERRSHAEQEAGADAAATAADLVAGLRVLAGLRAGAAAAARYRRASRASLSHAVRAADAQGVVAGVTALASGIYLVVIAGLGAVLATAGAVSIGDLIALLGLSQFIFGPLSAVAASWPAIARGRASAARIRNVLDAPPVLGGADRTAPDVRGRGSAGVAVRGLVVAGIQSLDLEFDSGTMHGVVFAEANDADAFVAVLGGERVPNAGALMLNGRRLELFDAVERRAELMVWPHGALPPGHDLSEMVTGAPAVGAIGDVERATAPDVAAALHASAAADVVDRRADGLRAVVLERGSSLSGGEAQRVALARLLLERPPVLVLHEPCSALDAVTESAVASALRSSRDGLTTIVVTTSATLLAACDRIVLVTDGAVITGTHSDLAQRDRRYIEAVER